MADNRTSQKAKIRRQQAVVTRLWVEFDELKRVPGQDIAIHIDRVTELLNRIIFKDRTLDRSVEHLKTLLRQTLLPSEQQILDEEWAKSSEQETFERLTESFRCQHDRQTILKILFRMGLPLPIVRKVADLVKAEHFGWGRVKDNKVRGKDDKSKNRW